MKKKKLKGFTLLELILVMAIFGILMAAIMSIINPLNKISKRASIQEANSAAVDNVKTYLESSIRYSECIEAFPAGLTDNSGKSLLVGTTNGYTQSELNNTFGVSQFGSSANTVTPEQAAVINFIDNHYCNRANASVENKDASRLSGIVRMLKINNADGGKITEYEYEFTAGYTYTNYFAIPTTIGSESYEVGDKDPEVHRVNATVTEKSHTDVINPTYYENYSFFITPGYNKMETIEKNETNSEGVTKLSGFNYSDDSSDTYYAALEPVDKDAISFTRQLFSLSIVTYKNDTTTDADGNVVSEYRGTCKESSTEEYQAFKSPFALSSANMSLLNINTNFGESKWASDCYGPVRYNGKPKDSATTYTPTVKVVDPDTSNWKYAPITADQAPKINYGDRLFTHAEATDASDSDCIYFIYTLPEFK